MQSQSSQEVNLYILTKKYIPDWNNDDEESGGSDDDREIGI
jgi:hypothetical protein